MAGEGINAWLDQLIAKLDAAAPNDNNAALKVLQSAAEQALGDVQLVAWGRLLTNEAHLIARGRSASLIQQVSARADRSPLTQALDAWLKTGRWTRPWLRKRGRPREDRPSPCLRTFEGSDGPLFGLALLGEKHVAATCQDGYLRVWSLDNGVIVQKILANLGPVVAAPGEGPDVVFANPTDGDFNPALWRLEAATLERGLSGSTAPTTALAYSPQGKVAAAGQDGVLRIWTLSQSGPPQALKGHSQSIASVALSPDGRRALSGGVDATLRLWDIQSGACRVYKGHPQTVTAVAFSPDGRRALSGSVDGSIRVWDVDSAKNLSTLPGHPGGTFAIAPLSHGRWFLSGGGDKLVRLWDLDSGSCLKVFPGHSSTIVGLAVLPDGRRALSASEDGTVRLWDLEASAPSQITEGLHSTILSVSFLPGGRRALSASADGLLRLWDTEAGATMQTLKVGPGQITYAAAHLEKSAAVTTSDDGYVRLWDLSDNKQLKAWRAHSEMITCLLLHQDARRAFTGSLDGTIKLWELETGRLIRTFSGHTQRIHRVELYPDGRRIVSVSPDKTLRLWDTDTGSCIGTHRGTHYTEATGFAIHPEGAEFALGTHEGLSLWDLGTGKQKKVIDPGWGSGDAICFTTDARLVAGGAGRSLRVFTSSTGPLLVRWEADAPITACAVSPRGRIAYGDATGNVVFLDPVLEGERRSVGPRPTPNPSSDPRG